MAGGANLVIGPLAFGHHGGGAGDGLVGGELIGGVVGFVHLGIEPAAMAIVIDGSAEQGEEGERKNPNRRRGKLLSFRRLRIMFQIVTHYLLILRSGSGRGQGGERGVVEGDAGAQAQEIGGELPGPIGRDDFLAGGRGGIRGQLQGVRGRRRADFLDFKQVTERGHGRAFHFALGSVEMAQLPVQVVAHSDVRQIRADANCAELDGIVPEEILGDAVAEAPAAGDVGADGHDMGFGFAAQAGDLGGSGVGLVLGEAGEFQSRDQIADGGGVGAGSGQDDVADDATLSDLGGMAGGAAIGAVHLQAERGIAGPLVGIDFGGIQDFDLAEGAQLEDGTEDEAAPGQAQRKERTEKDAKTGFHDLASCASIGPVTTAANALSNRSFQMAVAAKMFTAKSTAPTRRKTYPSELTRR